MSRLTDVVERRRLNAVLGWTFVAFLWVMTVTNALAGRFLWAGFAAAVASLAMLPALAYRRLLAMLPWEVLALASLPVVGQALVVGRTLGGVTLTGRVTNYLAVAAIALIVAVELDVFTPVRMNYSFAVLFVVVATMATAALVALAQWGADVTLGTTFMLNDRPEAAIERALMWDFVAATVAGLFAGVLFEFYFRRMAEPTARVPELAGESG
ncbi:MAG: hypothetical protein ABEJ78_08490 [Haloferacaceae archaeon]